MLTALLEYLNLLTQVAESGPANAGPAGPRAPALQNKHSKQCLEVVYTTSGHLIPTLQLEVEYLLGNLSNSVLRYSFVLQLFKSLI